VRLSGADITAEASRLSGSILLLSIAGPKAVLTNPRGKSVSFDLKRSDLDLPMDQFSSRVLSPAVDTLMKEVQ
jgi:hypothetical protein